MTTSIEEKQGGAPFDKKRSKKSNAWINDCSLVDMGALGNVFTWRGLKWRNRGRVYERLDRALCNAEWLITFPETIVKVLPRVKSDHRPLLTFLHGNQATVRGGGCFRFEACWLTHPAFKDFMKDS